MGVKRGQGAQNASHAKRNKADLFKALNLPSTSSSSDDRKLDKQISEPHGGQPAIDSQESLDNAPMTVSCPTKAATEAMDNQPLAEQPAVIAVADTDKESHIVLADMIGGDRIPDTQIDPAEPKAEGMHIGEPEEKPNGDIDNLADMPDGFSTPPANQLRSLMEAVDSDPEACEKYFQNMRGKEQKIDKSSLDSLETQFERLSDTFATIETAPEQDEHKPPVTKKQEDLENVVNNGAKWDPKCGMAQAFRREHAKDPHYMSLGRAQAQKYKLEWAAKTLTELKEEHTKTEGFSRVDSTMGTYKNFGQLVVSQGGICMGGPKDMGPKYGVKATRLKIHTHIYIYIYTTFPKS